MSDAPLLSICIPSYNRSERVFSLVVFLLENVVAMNPDEIELIVVNNCSSDNTESLLKPLSDCGVRLVHRTHHLPSAEANMFASLEFCNGRFVWFHGDDDIPNPQAVLGLLKSIKENDVDLYVFNIVNIDENGTFVSERAFNFNGDYINVKGDDIVFACGFSYSLAGISSVVFRKNLAREEYIREIMDIQEIYAHVAWLIRCFFDTRVRVVALPLVYYRTKDPQKELSHFQAYAKRCGLPGHHIWGVGLAALMEYLVDSGALTTQGVSRIYDGRRDGSRFRFLDELVNHIYLHAKLSIKLDDERNRLHTEDFVKARNFLYKVDLFMYDRLSLIREMVRVSDSIRMGSIPRGKGIKLANTLSCSYEKLLVGQLSQNYYRPFSYGVYFGYDLYKVPSGWVGILSSSKPSLRDRVLSYMDPVDEFPCVLVGESVESIRSVIYEAREGQGGTMVAWGRDETLSRDLIESIDLLVKGQSTLISIEEGRKRISEQSLFIWRVVFWYGPVFVFRMLSKGLPRRIATVIRRLAKG